MKKLLYAICAAGVFMMIQVPEIRALSLNGVVAYPVPFNPNTHVLSVDNPLGSPVVSSVTIEIFDINGDGVFKRQYSTLSAIKWNGRNGAGRKVKPGMYIVKVTAEDNSGGFDRKVIRILVDY